MNKDPELKDIDLTLIDLTDNSRMEFGKHEGKKLKDVPAGYLLWCFDEIKNLDPRLKKYIRDNLDELYERKEEENDLHESYDDWKDGWYR